MAWVRLHDGALHNAKIAVLSDGAFRLWIVGLTYCQSTLSDGFIPNEIVKRQTGVTRYVRELTHKTLPNRAALWRKVRGGFHVHDYLEWNTGRDEILRKRAQNAHRVQKLRNALRTPLVTRSERVCNAHPSTKSTEKNKYSAADAPRKSGAAVRPRNSSKGLKVLERLCHEVEEADRMDWANMIDALKMQAVKHGVAHDGDALTQAVMNVAHAPGSPFAHLIQATEPLKGRTL